MKNTRSVGTVHVLFAILIILGGITAPAGAQAGPDTVLDSLYVEYWGVDDVYEGYTVDIYLSDSDTIATFADYGSLYRDADVLYFSLVQGVDAPLIDAGTYRLDFDDELRAGHVLDASYFVDATGELYGTVKQATVAMDVYGDTGLTGAKEIAFVEVDITNLGKSAYTIVWTIETTGGEMYSGDFTGTPVMVNRFDE